MVIAALVAWQVDFESCALADFAVHLDVTAALLDDSEYGREAESGSLGRTLRREEWLEDAARTEASMPQPVSEIASRTCSPASCLRVRLRVALIEFDVFRFRSELCRPAASRRGH